MLSFVTAAEMRVLLAEPLAHVSIEVKKGPLTLNKILVTLSTMISVSECEVFGYLGLDDDIIVLVAPITQNPTTLQVSSYFNLVVFLENIRKCMHDVDFSICTKFHLCFEVLRFFVYKYSYKIF